MYKKLGLHKSLGLLIRLLNKINKLRLIKRKWILLVRIIRCVYQIYTHSRVNAKRHTGMSRRKLSVRFVFYLYYLNRLLQVTLGKKILVKI